MSSYVTDAQKLKYGSVFNNIHDTFAREVVVWKTPKRTVVSSNLDYNFLYHEQREIKVEYTPVSGIFECRIQWQDPKKTDGWPEIRAEVPGNFCRIKSKKDMLDFMSGAESIVIDSREVQSYGGSKPHGLFENDFYTMYFKETN